MIKKLLKLNLHILLVYVLLAFPMFYFVYKFGVLLQGYKDLESYLKLYENLNPSEVDAPFNMRLISASFVHFMDKIGFAYPTECSIDGYPMVNKRIFFNSIFFNFICISFTCFSLYSVFTKLGFNKLWSFTGGVLYLLGFGTIFYFMMPGPDALSVLIFTWVLYFYVKKSYWILPLFGLLIFQREYYFLAFMVIAIMDLLKHKSRYYLWIFVAAIVSFMVYFMLRKTVFHSAQWARQESPEFLFSTLLNSDLQLMPLVKQTLMTMNLYLVYLFVLLYKKHKGLEINRHHFFITLLLLAEITMLSFAATFGTNNGRYFYMNIPFFIYYMLMELKPLDLGLLKESR